MPDAATRVEPPTQGDERTVLTSFIDYHRATLRQKCEGLSDDELRRRAAAPSNLSLLGLVRHMAEVEHSWFGHGLAGGPQAFHWISEDDRDADFDHVETADVAEAFAAWEAECAAARRITADHDLDDTFANRLGVRFSLRWILVHMVEEYARHNGHADLLRERLDGATGE